MAVRVVRACDTTVKYTKQIASHFGGTRASVGESCGRTVIKEVGGVSIQLTT